MTEQKQWLFQYTTPEVPEGRVEEMSVADVEKYLLEKLEEQKDDPRKALWELANFYKRTGQVEQAFQRLQALSNLIEDHEAGAQLMLSLGQTAEVARDFRAAVQLYEHGLSLAVSNAFTRYYLHNNAGYSCNQLGQFEDGERHCRAAIAINPDRHNAYKNLGIALEGLGRLREAAQCFVNAVQANASDPRALWHLKELLEAHPELVAEFEWAYEQCCCGVGTALAARDQVEAEMQRKIAEGRVQ